MAVWVTRRAAARMLGVDPATVTRMRDAGLLRTLIPGAAPGEKPPALYSSESVRELAAARKRSRAVGVPRCPVDGQFCSTCRIGGANGEGGRCARQIVEP